MAGDHQYSDKIDYFYILFLKIRNNRGDLGLAGEQPGCESLILKWRITLRNMQTCEMARSLAEGWNNQGVRHLRVPALLNTLSVSFFWTIPDFWTFSSVWFFWAPSLVQYGFLGFLLGMDSSVQRPWDLCTWSKSNLVIEFHLYPMPWHCYDTSISGDEVLYKRLQTSWRPVLPASLRSPLPSTCHERTSPKLIWIQSISWKLSFYSYQV